MVSPAEVLDRIASGYYGDGDTLTVNNELCSVLDDVIECFVDEGEPATTSPGSCSNLWSVDRCLDSFKWNETVRQECWDTRLVASESSKKYSEMHCDSFTGEWSVQTPCHPDTYEQVDTNTVPSFGNYTQDYRRFEEVKDYDASLDSSSHILWQVKEFEIVKKFVTVGHVISLTSLVIAITLLLLLRRLHCTRIYIHINLMVTFMFRGLMWIFHTVAFENPDSAEQKLAMASLQLGQNIFSQYNASFVPHLLTWKQEWCEPYQNANYFIPCRFFFVILNYTVTANYYWLLVEGLYLALLLRARNAKRNHKLFMRFFLVLGWAFPWFSVLGATTAKLVSSSKINSCWFEDPIDASHWIIHVPIVITVLINFIIFVVVIKVVGSKLRGNQQQRDCSEDYKWRLMKSTLALIPLLGIQYLITVFIVRIENPTWSRVKEAFELVFVSIQGFLVAFIYCFLNGEIQDECKRCWRSWKMEWELKVRSSRKRNASSHTSLTTLYTNYPSRKPSAASATSSKRKDSVFVDVKSSGDVSPKQWRHASTYFAVSEQFIPPERRSQNSDSPSLKNGGPPSPHRVQGPNNTLLVPVWNDQCNSSTPASTSRKSGSSSEGVPDDESESLVRKLNDFGQAWKDFKTSSV